MPLGIEQRTEKIEDALRLLGLQQCSFEGSAGEPSPCGNWFRLSEGRTDGGGDTGTSPPNPRCPVHMVEVYA